MACAAACCREQDQAMRVAAGSSTAPRRGRQCQGWGVVGGRWSVVTPKTSSDQIFVSGVSAICWARGAGHDAAGTCTAWMPAGRPTLRARRPAACDTVAAARAAAHRRLTHRLLDSTTNGRLRRALLLRRARRGLAVFAKTLLPRRVGAWGQRRAAALTCSAASAGAPAAVKIGGCRICCTAAGGGGQAASASGVGQPVFGPAPHPAALRLPRRPPACIRRPAPPWPCRGSTAPLAPPCLSVTSRRDRRPCAAAPAVFRHPRAAPRCFCRTLLPACNLPASPASATACHPPRVAELEQLERGYL